MASTLPKTRFRARIFRNGRNQAIRIPVELSLDSETVTIEKEGDALIVRPEGPVGWHHFFKDPALVMPGDFDTGEDPPAPERGDVF